MDHLDAATLAEARALVAKAGMEGSRPQDPALPSSSGDLFAIALIDSPQRDPGFSSFDIPDPNRPGVVRSAYILKCIREGTAMTPLVLRTSGDRYLLREGFHRFHLAAALGFTHVRATINDWDFEVP